MKKITAIVGMLAFAASVFGSVIVGPVYDPFGQKITSAITFKLQEPTVVGTNFYTRSTLKVLTDTNGMFSVTLSPGNWTAQVGPMSDIVSFSVPNDTNTYALASLLPSGAIFMTRVSPFVMANPNLAAGLTYHYLNDPSFGPYGTNRVTLILGATYWYNPTSADSLLAVGTTFDAATQIVNGGGINYDQPVTFVASSTTGIFANDLLTNGQTIPDTLIELTTNLGTWDGISTGLIEGTASGLDGAGITNADAGTTVVPEYGYVGAALTNWQTRLGSLYFPNGQFSQTNPFVLNNTGGQFGNFFTAMDIRGNAYGASQWIFKGTNATMLDGTSAHYAPDFHNIALLNKGGGTNNIGYAQAQPATGTSQMENVGFFNWGIGAIIGQSGDYLYGLNLVSNGIGLYFPTLSDTQVLHVRSLYETNAAVVVESREMDVNYNAFSDQIGVLVGGGGFNRILAGAEGVSNCMVAIGYPPPSVFNRQGLTLTTGTIGGNDIGNGYVYPGTSNSFSAGNPAAVKLWTNSYGLLLHNMFIGCLGVVSMTNIADSTPMMIDLVNSSSAGVTFSDGTTIAAFSPGTHYGVNYADAEYTMSKLVYSRNTNGDLTMTSASASQLTVTNAPTLQATNAAPSNVTIGTTAADRWVKITNNGTAMFIPAWITH